MAIFCHHSSCIKHLVTTTGEVDKTKNIWNTQDVACQILVKSVDVSRSYSKNKKDDVFETQCIYFKYLHQHWNSFTVPLVTKKYTFRTHFLLSKLVHTSFRFFELTDVLLSFFCCIYQLVFFSAHLKTRRKKKENFISICHIISMSTTVK